MTYYFEISKPIIRISHS